MLFWHLGQVKSREPKCHYTKHGLDPTIVGGSEVGPVDTVAAEDHMVSQHSVQDNLTLRLPGPSSQTALLPACS